ncbi:MULTISPECIES: hypothetical protein [unclassified Paenibacillus]|uniref:hypothetical protein n=1 Tax=unclassified Paenibacillus TaxID=185978 RepID=UPI0020B821B2|nr:hypothetical protein [Paenibacillus sp. Lou8.1]MCP3807169.1 hypothetical protein [Paenibacillus sp. Lou8.1]
MSTIQTRIYELNHFRNWITTNPDRVDADVRPAALDWLSGEISKLEKKQNARRVGRTLRVRAWLKSLVIIILSSFFPERKG